MSDQEFFPRHPASGVNGNGHAAPTNGERPLEEDEISLQDIVEVLYQGKWIIVGCFLAVFAATAAYTFLKAPEYEAASLLFVDNQQRAPQLSEMMGIQPENRNINNEIEILKSRRIAQRVAQGLMDQRYVPGTQQELSILQSEDEENELTERDVVNRLQNNYAQISPLGREVDFIRVTGASTMPQEAALVANLYAEEYVEYNRTSSRSRMTASREFLDSAVVNFQDELQEDEQALQQFLDQEQVVAPDAQAEQLLQQVGNLQQMQAQAQMERGMARSELEALQQQAEQLTPEVSSQIASLDAPVIDQLTQRIAQLQAEVEDKYAKNPDLRQNPEQDPDLVSTLNRIQELRQNLNARSDSLVQEVLASGVSTAQGQNERSTSGAMSKLRPLQDLRRQIMAKQIELNAQEERLDIINDRLSQYRQQLGDIPRKEIVLNRLERSLQTRQQTYLTLMEKLMEARVAEQSEMGYVDIIDEALVPEQPVRPRVPLNLALGTILGLMLGVSLTFLRNALDTKVHRPEDLRKQGYNVVGVVPNMDQVIESDFEGRERVAIEGHSYSTNLITLLNPLSPIAESYRRLRTNIQFSRPDRDVRTVLVTSSGPGEGKSVTSTNLAIAMAQTGKRTVYVDADLRRARGHEIFGTQREPGLVEMLFDEAFTMQRFAADIDDLYMIPAGKSVPNPSEVLGSEKMEDLLRRLRSEFDYVVVDTPPVLAVTDAALVASRCDATVLVSSADETHWRALERSTETLYEVNAELIGVLLNRFDPKKAYGRYGGGYGYGYGYGYGEYYGEKPAGAEART